MKGHSMKIAFMTIGTNDMDASVLFYTEALNFALTNRMSPSPGVELAFLKDPSGVQIELIKRASNPPSPTAPARSPSPFMWTTLTPPMLTFSPELPPALRNPEPCPAV